MRPRTVGRSAELLQHRLVEKERDVQLLTVLAQEQRLVRAGQGRVPVAESGADEEVAHGPDLDSMDRLQELLQLRQPPQPPHCTNPLRGTTPWRSSTDASRSLPVFSQRSYRRSSPASFEASVLSLTSLRRSTSSRNLSESSSQSLLSRAWRATAS